MFLWCNIKHKIKSYVAHQEYQLKQEKRKKKHYLDACTLDICFDPLFKPIWTKDQEIGRKHKKTASSTHIRDNETHLIPLKTMQRYKNVHCAAHYLLDVPGVLKGSEDSVSFKWQDISCGDVRKDVGLYEVSAVKKRKKRESKNKTA